MPKPELDHEGKRDIPTPIGDETIVYQGKMIEIINQRMKIGSSEVTFERARRSPGTRLLITSQTGKILLTKEYRNEIERWDYRLPGGKVFDSLQEYNEALKNNEDMLAKSQYAARKEAREEVGIEAEVVSHFYTSKCGGTVEWDLHYFAVRVLSEQLGEQKLEAGENIEAGWYTPEEATDLALSENMSEDRSAAVLIRYITRNIQK